jgi:hypothetical protein
MLVTALLFSIYARFYRERTYVQGDEEAEHAEAVANGVTAG